MLVFYIFPFTFSHSPKFKMRAKRYIPKTLFYDRRSLIIIYNLANGLLIRKDIAWGKEREGYGSL